MKLLLMLGAGKYSSAGSKDEQNKWFPEPITMINDVKLLGIFTAIFDWMRGL